MTRGQAEDGRPGLLDVEVWAIAVRQPEATVARLSALLDPQEARRAATEPRYAVAHGAVRLILAERLGCEARELRRSLGPHGKPGLLGAGARLAWNLSGSGGWALLAVLPEPPPAAGPGAGPPSAAAPAAVGVDVERLVPHRAALRLADRYFPEPEARLVRAAAASGSAGEVYTRLWTYKEAYVKVFGGRLMEGLPASAPDLDRTGGEMAGPLGGCRAAEVAVPGDGYRAAVAVTGPLAPRPRVRIWEAARAPAP